MALKFSFILPCYNVEKYIARCLDSILNQDIPHDEYEIICVNDCSPDNLSNVVRQYQQEYPNIILIEHTENKTAGGARNTGIDYAQGEYIWFVDPDDQIMPNSLLKLWNEVKECNVDILFFNHNLYTYEGECIEHKVVPNSDLLSGQDFLTKYFPKQTTKICSVYNELMRTEHIISSKFRYPEIPASQDVVFLWEVICNAQKVKSIDSVHYSVHRRKLSTTGASGRCTARTCFSFSIQYPIALLQMIGRNEINDNIVNDLYRAIYRTVNDNSRVIFNLSFAEKKKIYYLIQYNKKELELIGKYMNTMTKRIFNSYLSFLLWFLIVTLLKLRCLAKNRLIK